MKKPSKMMALTVRRGGVQLFANVMSAAERVDLGHPLCAARLHQLAQLPQRDAILRRAALHRRHAAGLRTPPDNTLALEQSKRFKRLANE